MALIDAARDVTGFERCALCWALCLEQDIGDHRRWHAELEDSLRRAFDGIYHVESLATRPR